MVTIGGFEATIADITSANGNVFSGGAYVSIAMLGGLPIYFEFEAITIENCNGVYQVTDGELNVPTDGSIEDIINDFIGDFDPNDGNLLDNLETALDVVQGLVEDMTGTDDYYSDVHNLLEDITDLLPDFPFIDEELIQPIEDAMACMANVDPDAAPTDPNSFETCQNNMEQAIEDLLNQIANLYNADYQVPFYKEDNQMFGFDKQDYDIHQSNYDQIDEIAGEPYSVSWKSVRIGETDEVNARKKNGEAIPNIIFKDGQENEITDVVPIGDNFKQVTVQGQSSHGAVQEIFAIQTEEETANHDHNEDGTADDSHIHIAGKLNVVTYRPQTLQVAIVPVGGVSIPGDLAAQLTKIYMQAGVAVDVATIDGFNPTYSSPFPDIPSGWLSAYSPEMNDIIGAFQDMPDVSIDDDTYYVFVLPVSHEVPGKVGFMPKKRQYGFIFNGGLSGTDALVKTIAHELGHGAYRLKHTFETYAENPELNGEPSANLMDYGDGTVLRKYQWDLIHEPEGNFTLFDSDEEGEYTVINVLNELANLKNDDGTFTFVAPSGLPITVPSNTTTIAFNTGDDIRDDNSCFDGFDILPFGTLRYFIADGVKYTTSINCTNIGEFTRYKQPETEGNQEYIDIYTPTYDLSTQKAIIGFPCFDGGRLIFQVGEVSVATDLSITSVPSSNYRATGNRKDFDFFVGMNTSNPTEVYGQAYPAYTALANTLLDKVGRSASCGSPAALYAFVHAHQISFYPAFYSNCTESLSDLDAEEIRQIAHTRYVNANTIVDEGNLPLFVNNQSLDDIFNDVEIELWKQKDKSIYRAYQQTVEEEWTEEYFNSYMPTIEDHEPMKLFNFFRKWKTEKCAFASLSLNQRKIALRVLSHLELSQSLLPEFLQWDDEEEQEDLYNYIISTTPTEDYAAIVNLFEDEEGTGNANYSLFFRVANKMNDSWISGTDNHGFEGYISQLSLMTLNARPHQGTCSFESLPVEFGCYIDGIYQQGHEMILNRLGDAITHCYESEYFPSLSQIKIRSVHTSGVCPGPSNNGIVTSATPFTYVGIHFANETQYTLPNNQTIDIPAGGYVIVPLCFADLIFKKYISASFHYEARTAGDVLAIAGGFFTSGQSAYWRFISRVDALYGLVDLFIMAPDQYEIDATGLGDVSQELHSLWNSSGLVLAAATGTGFLVELSPGIYQFATSKIKPTWTYLRETHGTQMDADFINLLKNTYSKVKNTTFGVSQEGLRFLNHLKAEIVALELNQLLTLAPDFINNTTLHIQQNFWATIFYLNTEYAIASGQYLDNLYHLKPIRYTSTTDGLVNIATLDNVRYIDETDNAQVGKVELYRHPDDASDIRAYTVPLNVSTHGLPDFWQLFNNKGWNWDFFDTDFADWAKGLSSTKREDLKVIMRTWDEGEIGEGIFVALKADMFTTPSVNHSVFRSILEADIRRINSWKVLRNGAISIKTDIDDLDFLVTIQIRVEDANNMNGWEVLENVFSEQEITHYDDFLEALRYSDEKLDYNNEWIFEIGVNSNSFPSIYMRSSLSDFFKTKFNQLIDYISPPNSDVNTVAKFRAKSEELLEEYIDMNKQGYSFVISTQDRSVALGEYIETIPGILDVHVHGGPWEDLQIHTFGLNDEAEEAVYLIDAENLAFLIRNHPGYEDCNAIRLLACWGEQSDAQKVAEYLNKPVMGADHIISLDRNNNYQPYMLNGTIKLFSPE